MFPLKKEMKAAEGTNNTSIQYVLFYNIGGLIVNIVQTAAATRNKLWNEKNDYPEVYVFQMF